ncbi:MAG TPA: sugar ABC transporter permease [Atribacter sp.]|jgi:multiple sugar transport system permease protein|uniref:carbohydrate ABC transporter permease n=1 Tax=Atribacter sp. TaxID=2847780 RepID=UPI002D0A2147|nr:sugar ABC transporter permease [Atribacter sp.]HQK83285.1 sugar ABC transporter permease [Atribacter sp.]
MKKWIIAPAILVPILVGVIPFGYGVYLSFTNWRLANPGINFIGLENYYFLFKDQNFWKAVLISFEYVGMAISIELAIGSLIAYLLTKNRRGQWFFRSIIIIPLTVAPILLSLMWKLMLSTSGGVVNYFLGFIGISPVAWLADPKIALLTLAFIDAYIYTPFVALILFAGLQSLPRDPYEAALVDGASGFDSFRYITWPLMRPLVLVSVMFRLVISFKIFDTIYATTSGGPGTSTTNLHLWVYLNAFRYGDMAYAMAGAVILYLIIYILTNVFVRMWKNATSYI